MPIRLATTADHAPLLDIWLRSVRATHTFLSEAEIQVLVPAVRDQAFPNLELWVLCQDDGTLMGFMGLAGNSLEALFLAPEYTGQGGGKLLLDHARQLKGPLTTDVNEQNPAALQFYLANGFEQAGRSSLDNAGRPYPLLHLREKVSR
ncbi:MAG TPA: GNAT family N-acetyltransferase [Gemmatales bacterium]|nr:GNAT family N-acetyltransferase [Gemmatales bacterium]